MTWNLYCYQFGLMIFNDLVIGWDVYIRHHRFLSWINKTKKVSIPQTRRLNSAFHQCKAGICGKWSMQSDKPGVQNWIKIGDANTIPIISPVLLYSPPPSLHISSAPINFKSRNCRLNTDILIRCVYLNYIHLYLGYRFISIHIRFISIDTTRGVSEINVVIWLLGEIFTFRNSSHCDLYDGNGF